MTRRLNYLLLALFVIVSVPYYWFLIDDPASNQARLKPVTMAELRKLASALPGPRPDRVRAEL
ncbi:MAG: hypothetical protein P8Y58_17860, partial [Novosphingobium sp.]